MAARGRANTAASFVPVFAEGSWPVWGHERQVHSLQQAVATGRVSHAYLVSGPDAVGKNAVARALAQAVLCADPGRPDPVVPCGTCAACQRIRRGTHPDVETYSLATQAEVGERSGKNTGVTIETVRSLRASTALKPMEGSRRFILLDDAETMQETAQEALLKTLEEPPPAVTLLLLSDDGEALLPTIRSRCQKIELGPVPAPVVAQGLIRSGLVADRAQALAGLCRGRPGWAIRAAGDPTIEDDRRRAIEQAAAWISGGNYERLVGAVRLGDRFAKDRGGVFDEIETALGVWRDALLHRLGLPEHAGFGDHETLIQQVADPLPPEQIVRALASVQTCLADLEANVRPKLAIETMVLEWPSTTTSR